MCIEETKLNPATKTITFVHVSLPEITNNLNINGESVRPWNSLHLPISGHGEVALTIASYNSL